MFIRTCSISHHSLLYLYLLISFSLLFSSIFFLVVLCQHILCFFFYSLLLFLFIDSEKDDKGNYKINTQTSHRYALISSQRRNNSKDKRTCRCSHLARKTIKTKE